MTAHFRDDEGPSGLGYYLGVLACILLLLAVVPIALFPLASKLIPPWEEAGLTSLEVLMPEPEMVQVRTVVPIQVINAIRIPKVIPHIHADEEHGIEAQEIRNCLDKNGAYQVWRTFDKSIFYLFCQLSDGRWGFQAINKNEVDGQWHEKTAFVKADGSWAKLMKYMEKIASRFNGLYPWE